jgi:hypothetical protein
VPAAILRTRALRRRDEVIRLDSAFGWITRAAIAARL